MTSDLISRIVRVPFAGVVFLSFCTINATPVRAVETQNVNVAKQRDAVEKLRPFLNSNCIDCHDGPSGEGNFDLNSVLAKDSFDLSDPQNMHQWVRVYDRVNDGEMPPPEVSIDSKERQAFLKETHQWIDQSESMAHATGGRAEQRRLTNDQLQWTLCDLFSIDLPLSTLIPEEQRTDGFRNIASAQSMSHYHLQDHLRAIDTALDYAFSRAAGEHQPTVEKFSATRIANKRKGQRNRDPEMRNGAAVIWNSTMSFYGRISRTRVQDSGWYRITLDASSLNMKDDRGMWCSVRSGECVSNAPLMSWVGSLEAKRERATFTFEAWIPAGHLLEIRPADATLKTARFKGGQVGLGEGEPQKAPGIAMHSLTLERFFPGGEISDVHAGLFGELEVEFDKGANRWRLNSQTPRKDLAKQLRRFARSAFRRPVSKETLQPYLDTVNRAVNQKADPIEALRNAYRAILCSPRFIYFQELPGKLDDHALANRLSFAFTGRAPDKKLRWAADQGTLSDKQTLLAQTRRLVRGESLQHFVADFTDQWLDLTDIGFTQPDRRLFKDFDLVVQEAMVSETQRYVETLVSENRPANWLVQSDFTWLNNRLAEYYGMDESIEADQWKRVSVADHPHRGGLMTHGSILKVTANGNNTSPVIRGVWICDRLLGVPIPDPPENVPAIEPDIRGATTVREILEKHRSQVECAACHARIDPPGFALEHFDAAGRWRDHYVKRVKKSYVKGPKIDSAYQMPDGRAFDSFVQFRQLAADNQDAIARNFAAKLLVYCTGKEITFADRKVLDKIVQQTKPKQHRLRDLIEAVVTSETFLNK